MEVPALGGNWVDFLIILISLFYLWGGWQRGFLLGILDLVGFLLSFFLSLKNYSFFGFLLVRNFSIPKGIANALGFLICGFLVELVYSTILNIFYRRFYRQITVNRKIQRYLPLYFHIDKFFGFIPAVGEALIFTAFILTLLVTLPIQGKVKKDILSSKLGGPLVSHTQGIERQLNRIFGEAVNETLTFITVNPNPISAEKIDLGFTQREVKIDESAEATMFFLVNKEREKMGLGKLSISTNLRGLARDYAKDMFARGFFAHYDPDGLSPFDRMEKRGIDFRAAGENLALAPNVFLAHQGLMNSPGHRANILSVEFKKVGIGVIDGGIYGQIFVQEFTD